jgi:beta-lactamase regulating signal transducer with metallopeptidase domain
MNTYPQPILELFYWMLRSSFYATILLALILVVRMAVRKKFRFRAMYWLWMILLLRLIWPFNLQSAFSVFNLIPQKLMAQTPVFNPAAEEQQNPTPMLSTSTEKSSSDQTNTFFEILPEADEVEIIAPSVIQQPLVPVEKPLNLRHLLCSVWIGGVVIMGLYVLWNNLRLWQLVKSQRLITRQDILELLEDCKAQISIQTVIGIVETQRIQTPCLFGYLRPRLLLPSGTVAELSNEQLRYVFLHELAHLKRHDILIGWLMAMVQILHWFNPAVWFAMTQITRDRELACDELALSTLKENEPKAYGSTILTFLERFARAQKLPGMAGIVENQSLARRRITMIAAFKNTKTAFIPVIGLIILLVITTFTSAQAENRKVPKSSKDPNSPAVAEIKALPAVSKSRPVIISTDDGESAGKRSIAGNGHAVLLETPQKSELIAVMIYGSRYGNPTPPKENFHVWLCDEKHQILKDFEFPYSLFQRGEPKWVRMKTEFSDLPKKFYLCVGFNPEQTKGVYVHYDAESSGGSYTGLPDNGFKEFTNGDWMIRAMVRPLEPSGTASSVSRAQAGGLQEIIDTAEDGATVEIPEGTYTEPIRITKSLTIKGNKCVIDVTANEPAIFIDIQGKSHVSIEDVNIKWQLASSDTCEYPFAVAVKDSTAEIKNCTFRPLGNPQRSPVAVRSLGFSNMTLSDCDFSGFDYVVCYGEGTKGTLQDCFIRNCGHQGVILYSGAEVSIIRNIITGSKFHAVRTTGGTLKMSDNLILNNKNRGVYLGNKSGKGMIENNLLISNGTGIDGISACQFGIQNNVILKSEYAAISAIPQARLMIAGNVLMDNVRGIIIQKKEGQVDPVQSKIAKNVMWANKTDMENCESTDALRQKPDFVDPAGGNFTLTDEAFKNIGLKYPKPLFLLWQKYKAEQRTMTSSPPVSDIFSTAPDAKQGD